MNENKQYKIFISHSEKDKILASCLVDFLCSSFFISKEHILCSSVSETKIENASSFRSSILTAFQESKLCLFLVTENYVKSKNCMIELAWESFKPTENVFLFHEGEWAYDALPSLINDGEFSNFDFDGLQDLRKKVSKLFKARIKKENWEEHSKNFLKVLASKKSEEFSRQLKICEEINEKLWKEMRERRENAWTVMPRPSRELRDGPSFFQGRGWP